MHAFIIEDDYLISQAIQDILSDIGFTSFSFARSEDAAIAGAAEQTFDLITADARLLPGDGVKAVQVICTGKHIPVVFVTGYGDDIHSRVEGAVVVEKPIKVPQLRAAVQGAMTAVQERRS